MPTPNENPIVFADGTLSECAICGEPIVAGTDLCLECDPTDGECRPDECRHAEDEEDIA